MLTIPEPDVSLTFVGVHSWWEIKFGLAYFSASHDDASCIMSLTDGLM